MDIDKAPVFVITVSISLELIVPDLRRQLFSSSIFLLRNKRPRIRSGVVTKETRGR